MAVGRPAMELQQSDHPVFWGSNADRIHHHRADPKNGDPAKARGQTKNLVARRYERSSPIQLGDDTER